MKILATLFGAGLALAVLAAGSIFYGLLTMSVRQPALMTAATLLLYGGIAWFSIRTLRQPQPPSPLVSGLMIGGVIGALLCGLCSTLMALNSGAGLRFQ